MYKNIFQNIHDMNNQCILTLVRFSRNSVCTRGELFLHDAKYQTLEPSDYIIPEGIYLVRLSVSPRFSSKSPYRKCLDGKVPEIIGIKGHSGVRIHVGNYPSDTQGCILVGLSGGDVSVLDSVSAYVSLCTKLQNILSLYPDVFFTLKVVNDYEQEANT